MSVALVPPPLRPRVPVCAIPVPDGPDSDKSDVEDITFYDEDIGEVVQDDILSESIIDEETLGTEAYGFEQTGSIEEDKEDLFPPTAGAQTDHGRS
ncbi:hypothetical protein WOLCODRAFT_150632 [Wolfiporia cocos MD-104 SS10]|uniref:Uncharacterized protein n=1 Tax=Wolfiporia cocos (strain MD-104) TaxID=742152 RepID=A0A2H3JL40_WOLCO|nr:hypothetical protein WOLCODRAFT_150632 [Wolfiporia cocos MD-104 SS10]